MLVTRELKSVVLIALVLFVADVNAAPKDKQSPSGEKIYDVFPKSMRGRLKAAWKAKVKRTEKQVRSIKRSVSRERDKEKKAKLKELRILAEDALDFLKNKNDPPFIGIRIFNIRQWRVGSIGRLTESVKVLQIIDETTMLAGSGPTMFSGWSTKDFVDDDLVVISQPVWVTKSTSYTNLLGAKKTVWVVEQFDWEKWKKANVKK